MVACDGSSLQGAREAAAHQTIQIIKVSGEVLAIGDREVQENPIAPGFYPDPARGAYVAPQTPRWWGGACCLSKNPTTLLSAFCA